MPIVAVPCLTEYDHHIWTIATCGWGLLALTGDRLEGLKTYRSDEIRILLQEIDRHAPDGMETTVEDLLQFCWEYIFDQESGQSCPHCQGSGGFECDCCGGAGEIFPNACRSHSCPECGGCGRLKCAHDGLAPFPAVIDGRVVDLVNLLSILKAVQGACRIRGCFDGVGLGDPRPTRRLVASGDGWRLCIAAMGMEPADCMPVFIPAKPVNTELIWTG